MSPNDLTGFTEIHALLGRGTEFEGKLAFSGRVRIDGRFRGEIFGEDVLVVGEGAEVDATIEVGTLIVRGGVVRGEIRAWQLVEIHAPAKVYGAIRAAQLFLDKGAVFEGQTAMIEPGPKRKTL